MTYKELEKKLKQINDELKGNADVLLVGIAADKQSQEASQFENGDPSILTSLLVQGLAHLIVTNSADNAEIKRVEHIINDELDSAISLLKAQNKAN